MFKIGWLFVGERYYRWLDYFYFVSIVAFVLANIIRTTSVGFYYALLIVGLVFFFLGLMRRIRK